MCRSRRFIEFCSCLLFVAMLFMGTGSQAGVWDKAAMKAFEATAKAWRTPVDELLTKFVQSPQSRQAILNTMEKLGFSKSAPEIFRPEYSALLSKQILSHSLENNTLFRRDFVSGLNSFGLKEKLPDGSIASILDGNTALGKSFFARVETLPSTPRFATDLTQCGAIAGAMAAAAGGIGSGKPGQPQPEVGGTVASLCMGYKALKLGPEQALVSDPKLSGVLTRDFLAASKLISTGK